MDYLITTERLLDLLPCDVKIVCAHGPFTGIEIVPSLQIEDLICLQTTLVKLLDLNHAHEGEVSVNGNIRLAFSIAAFSNCEE